MWVSTPYCRGWAAMSTCPPLIFSLPGRGGVTQCSYSPEWSSNASFVHFQNCVSNLSKEKMQQPTVNSFTMFVERIYNPNRRSHWVQQVKIAVDNETTVITQETRNCNRNLGAEQITTYYYPNDSIFIISGVGSSPLGTAATSGLLHKPQMIDEGDYGAISGMKIGRGNRSTRRKPAPAPLCPPQIPHDQTRARTRAAAVGSQRLIAWAMARP
jgi:hypothetical protein